MRLSPGSTTPPELEEKLAKAGEDTERSMEIGVEWATRQCRELLDRGAPGIHFYTLNKSPATRKVHGNLSKR
jgi:methylenetetrahydrofolate reductase (NADPH)